MGLRVTDNDGAVDTDTASIAVAAANVAPTAHAGGPYSVVEGGAVPLDASGTTDPNQPAHTLTYQWDLDADGTFGETGPDATQGDEVGMAPTYSAVGLDGPDSVTVLLRVTDAQGLTDEDATSINLDNADPTIALSGAGSVDEGVAYTLTLGAITDPGDDTVTQWIVHWGDGESDTYDSGGDKAHTYGNDGTYTITVDLADEDGTHTGAGSLGLTVWPEVTDLSQVDFLLEHLSLANGSLYYRIETTHEGFLTLQVDESARLKLYDAWLTPLDDDGNQRIDWSTSAGTVYYVEVYGTNVDFYLRIANLLHHDASNSIVTVYGTDGDDTFVFAPTGSYQVTINGVAYHFDEAEVDAVAFDGGEGYDTVNLATLASSGNDSAELWPDHGTFNSAGVTTTLTDVDSINISGGSGEDTVIIHDSAGDDTLFARAAAAAQPVSLITMTDTVNSYSHQLDDFEILNAYSTSGIDTASLFDSDGPDKFISHYNTNRLRDDDLSDSVVDFNFRVKDFQYNHVYAKNGGVDLAEFHDKDGQKDDFKGYPTYSKMFKGLYQRRAKFFENVVAYATPGDGDYARLFDSDQNDSLTASPTETRLFSTTAGYDIRALAFDSVLARAKFGLDTAEFIGGAGDDLLMAKYIDGVTNQRSPKTVMMDRGTNGGVYEIIARKFDHITAHGGTGVRDIAKFWDTLGDDRFVADGDRAAMYGPGNELIYDVLAFEQVNINRVYGGNDTIEKNPPINFDLVEN